jgi:hypothetical protein
MNESEVKEAAPQDVWAIVEVMGHSQYAGRVSEYAGLGVPLVRVEVPAVEGQPAFEKLLGASAIFRVTPCTEEAARAAAESLRVRPLNMVALPAREPAQLPLDYDPENGEGWD